MIYRALDSNNDYTFGKGQQNFIKDADAVGQAIETRLKLLLGEWWEDQEDGLPLFQSIVGQSGQAQNLATADLLIQERILGTTGVSSIESFQSTYENRTYSLNCVVNTIYGPTTVEVTF